MSGRRPILPDPSCEPAHPGGLLRRMVLPALNRPMTDIARSLGISRQLLYSIVNEKASVTPEVAVRLGKLCGNGPRLPSAASTSIPWRGGGRSRKNRP